MMVRPPRKQLALVLLLALLVVWRLDAPRSFARAQADDAADDAAAADADAADTSSGDNAAAPPDPPADDPAPPEEEAPEEPPDPPPAPAVVTPPKDATKAVPAPAPAAPTPAPVVTAPTPAPTAAPTPTTPPAATTPTPPVATPTTTPPPVATTPPPVTAPPTATPPAATTTPTTAPVATTAGPGAAPGATTAAPGSSSSDSSDSSSSGGAAGATGPANTTGVGWPTPDDTQLSNISAAADSCTLLGALLGALGSEDAEKAGCGGGGGGATGAAGTPGGGGGAALQASAAAFAELRSGDRMREGLFTAANGESFCIAAEGLAAAADALSHHEVRATFASLDDPACDDDDATTPEARAACEQTAAAIARAATFMEDAAAAAGGGNASAASPPPSPSPPPGPDFAKCTRAFTAAGSEKRSVAIILVKWPRPYYRSEAECCADQNGAPGCGCKFGSGFTWDNLPPPSAYSRLFTDECDMGPSINRAYYDLSGGRVTFHSKLRVQSPSRAAPPADDGGDNSTAAAAAGPAPAVSTTLSEAATSASAVPTEPVVTDKSYLDPQGVDVYGWALLDGMRSDSGECRDWCGDAMAQLGVQATDYNHVICYPLYSSRQICDTCSGDGCSNTCPASSGITTGCGCGTCYYAWGAQSGCTSAVPPGARVGMGASMWAYNDDQTAKIVAGGGAPGPFISSSRGLKVYASHELGHNLGLTHTGAMRCRVSNGAVERAPGACVPDWYGDDTSFMGTGSSLQVPAVLRYKLRWLPRSTMRTHARGSGERRYTLRATTSRRPSWQPAAQAQAADGSGGGAVTWFNGETTLAVRIPLKRSPDDGDAPGTAGYSCPCSGGGACAQCSAKGACGNGPCCTEGSCADKGLDYLFVELTVPYRNDANPAKRGVTVRMAGDGCGSSRLLPTHVAKDSGAAAYLLTESDPTGATAGSMYEDATRGVKVILEKWSKRATVATIRVIA